MFAISVFSMDHEIRHLINLFTLYKSSIEHNIELLVIPFYHLIEVSKVAKIRNRYNQVPHLTQDTNGKVTNSQKTPQTRAKRSALSQPFPESTFLLLNATANDMAAKTEKS